MGKLETGNGKPGLESWKAAFVLAALAACAADVRAQAPERLTLDQAIEYADAHYPTVRVALQQVNAASAEVDVAHAAVLPRLDSLWQSNRATANNIFGQVFPQAVIPSMSGPVLGSPSSQSVWGSATGMLFSWEPFDFGLRDATVAGAEAAVTRARAGEALTRLDVQSAVASAFLDVAAADRAVAAVQADVDRRDVLARNARVLADSQLRPGAEASRADAERAAAQTRLIQTRQALTLATITLTQLLGVAGGTVTIDASTLLGRLPAAAADSSNAGEHPLLQARQAAVDSALAGEEVLRHTDYPRVYVLSSVFARGSGADPSGQFDGGIGGLGLDRANWAAGVQVVLPNVFDFSALNARKAAAAASEQVERARYDEARLAVSSQQQSAKAAVEATRAVAANTPVQLAAAQQSEAQARARYQAGLAGITELADAQDLLAQAEVQDQVARVDVWRALLSEAVASGNLATFLALLRP